MKTMYFDRIVMHLNRLTQYCDINITLSVSIII